MNDLERRLARLEARSRARGSLLLALLAVMGLSSTQTPTRPQPRYLRVQGLEVTDPRGRTVFRIGSTQAGGHVEVLGPLGKKAFEVAATRNGSYMMLYGAAGRARARLTGSEAGGELELMNTSARPAVLAGPRGAAGGLALRDDAGHTIALVGADEDGNGVLDIANVADKKRRSFGF